MGSNVDATRSVRCTQRADDMNERPGKWDELGIVGSVAQHSIAITAGFGKCIGSHYLCTPRRISSPDHLATSFHTSKFPVPRIFLLTISPISLLVLLPRRDRVDSCEGVTPASRVIDARSGYSERGRIHGIPVRNVCLCKTAVGI